MKRLIISLFVLLFGGLASDCARAQETIVLGQKNPHGIAMEIKSPVYVVDSANFEVSSVKPLPFTVSASDTIYFTFQSVQHNVIFDTPGSPANVPSSQSTTVKRQFTSAGTFNYHCSIHPQMTGSVTVTP